METVALKGLIVDAQYVASNTGECAWYAGVEVDGPGRFLVMRIEDSDEVIITDD